MLTYLLLDLTRAVVLLAVVLLCVIRITNLPRGHQLELEAWAFIFIAIGCFWNLCSMTYGFPLLDDSALDDLLANFITSVGVLLLCVNALYGRALSVLPDRRTREEAVAANGAADRRHWFG